MLAEHVYCKNMRKIRSRERVLLLRLFKRLLVANSIEKENWIRIPQARPQFENNGTTELLAWVSGFSYSQGRRRNSSLPYSLPRKGLILKLRSYEKGNCPLPLCYSTHGKEKARAMRARAWSRRMWGREGERWEPSEESPNPYSVKSPVLRWRSVLSRFPPRV